MICSKLASKFRCEIMTPAGERVDPDVYCKYAVPERLSLPERAHRAVQVQQVDLDDRRRPFARLGLDVLGTMPATGDVVSTTVGDESRNTELTRSSLTPPSGTASGTAICPASIAPRNATM